MSEKKTIQILLIDDDVESHTLVRNLLGRIPEGGYGLDSVFDYESAMGRLRDPAFAYDAILLDHHLGNHTGIEILKNLESSPLLPPVIFFTATENRALDSEALSLGVSDFLVKSSITSSRLDRSLRYAIQHRGNERNIVLKRATNSTGERDAYLALIQTRAERIRSLSVENGELNTEYRKCAEEILAAVRRLNEADLRPGRSDFFNPGMNKKGTGIETPALHHR